MFSYINSVLSVVFKMDNKLHGIRIKGNSLLKETKLNMLILVKKKSLCEGENKVKKRIYFILENILHWSIVPTEH